MSDLTRDLSGRYRDPSDALLSGRIGIGGKRTFHCHFRGITTAVGGAISAIDYLAREGDFENGHDDLLHVAGDRIAVKAAIAAIDACVRIRNGRTAERVAIATVFELPAAASESAMRDISERIVAYWKHRGHPAVAGVHNPAPKEDGRLNPHIHVVSAARPVASGGVVDRSSTAVPLRGKSAVRSERRAIAALINEVMARHGIECEEFHPGRLEDTGINRAAKKRVPARQYYVLGQRERDEIAVAGSRERVDERRRLASLRRQAAAETRDKRRLKAATSLSGPALVAAGLVTRRAMDNRLDGLRAQLRSAEESDRPAELTENQRETLTGTFERLGLDLPDLTTVAGQAEAWGVYRGQKARFDALRPQLDELAVRRRREREAKFSSPGMKNPDLEGSPSKEPTSSSAASGRRRDENSR